MENARGYFGFRVSGEVIAYDRLRVAIDLDRVRGFPLRPNAGSLWKRFRKRIETGAGTPAIVLTNDSNPLDFYDAWLKERREV